MWICGEVLLGGLISACRMGLIKVHAGWASSKYMQDGPHQSGKGAAVFADELSEVVDSGMGSITYIFGSKHCLN